MKRRVKMRRGEKDVFTPATTGPALVARSRLRHAPPRLTSVSRLILAMPATPKHFAVPKPGIPRSPLPEEHVNPHIRTSPSLPDLVPETRELTPYPSGYLQTTSGQVPGDCERWSYNYCTSIALHSRAHLTDWCRLDGLRSLLCVPPPLLLLHRVYRVFLHPRIDHPIAWRWPCLHPSQTRHWRDFRNHYVPCRIPDRERGG